MMLMQSVHEAACGACQREDRLPALLALGLGLAGPGNSDLYILVGPALKQR